MSDPKIVRSRVVVDYSADDGYACEVGYKGTKDAPASGLLSGLDEIARLLALFGMQDEARRVVDDAFGRVAAWKSKREAVK